MSTSVQMKAVSSAPSFAAVPLQIVLYWNEAEGVVGYNLYRRKLSETAMPKVPLNGRLPIIQVKTKVAFESVVPRGSSEWNRLQSAFTTMEQAASPVDPGEVIERGLSEQENAFFLLMAYSSLRVRIAAGLAFSDVGVVENETYVYELRGVARAGEVPLVGEVIVQAGHFVLPAAPSGIVADAGDSKVLVYWNRNENAHSYVVSRSTIAGGVYQVVSQDPILFNIAKDLDNNDLGKPGFVDFQRWGTLGHPTFHDVNGVNIFGPSNYVTYYYRVASVDILGRIGNWCSPVVATPVDKTPPMAPQEVAVNPQSAPSVGLAVSWKKVVVDTAGHAELDHTQSYRVYRSDKIGDLEDPVLMVSCLVYQMPNVDPTDLKTMALGWVDTDPSLVQVYGEKGFWYTVTCEDAHGNVSAKSAIISGRVPDTTPPGPTKMLGSEGHAESITIFWAPNSELDLAGYQIYRTVCDLGMPYRPKKVVREKVFYLPPDFALVGELLKEESEKRLKDTGKIYFDDASVPVGSPLCYAYWVRAFDKKRNLYPGIGGYPPIPSDQYVCERLQDETAPPVPIVSGLSARNNSVKIEWIASPTQDLYAFHVYRSEKEDGALDFVGGVSINGIPLSVKWAGIKPHCSDIPAESNAITIKQSFVDLKVESNKIYWYRVSALDWVGNESEENNLLNIPAVSTFTYDADLPVQPTNLSLGVSSPAGQCGLAIVWQPAFDAGLLEGFVVFRSKFSDKLFRQVSPIVQGNTFVDKSALRNTKYWYIVHALDKKGKLSLPSQPFQCQY